MTEIWSTSYGRALIVKTALFVPLLVLGWLNRSRLLGSFARLRRSAMLETLLLLAIVAVVGVLTELRPGDEATRRRASPPPRRSRQRSRRRCRRATRSSPHGELGSLAVAVARTPGRATVTILGPDGTGVDGRSVTRRRAPATPCGCGCYTAPAGARPVVRVAGRRHVRPTIRAAGGRAGRDARSSRGSRGRCARRRRSSSTSALRRSRQRLTTRFTAGRAEPALLRDAAAARRRS